ncbi:MAG: FkbM family methyltransferase [Ginsengibacter sp.]|jgi:FkbM family methyltransferase
MDNLTSYLKKIKRITIGAKSKKSYSQCGEDLIVQYIFSLRGIEKPSYLDIGANDPYTLSNTALFYHKGSRGINIEANPELAIQFKTLRRGDINLNIGIGDKEDELDFYVMKDNTLSTFSKLECDQMVNSGKELASVEKIKLTTISKVIQLYHQGIFPDFLSLDVEGMDFDILRSIDFTQSLPKVICVEAAEYSFNGSGERKNELIDFLLSKNYYEYANTNLNAIMVHRDFWFT